MQEAFLHFLWKMRQLPPDKLFTADGQKINIVKPGIYNTDAGPDFRHAEVYIGDTGWAGNIEMHLQTSDWDRHGHSTDEQYNNVILHVVHTHDKQPYEKPSLPVLALKDIIPEVLYNNYDSLIANQKQVACEPFLEHVPEIIKHTWLERVMVERLSRKALEIQALYFKNGNNWEETAYQVLAKSFGFKVNSDAFLALAASLSLKIILKYSNAQQTESLFFGQAGFLTGKFHDEYPKQLKKEYKYQASKHSLNPIAFTNWKMLRLHPANFPTLRISQFAELISKNQHLFSRFLEIKNLQEAHELLKTEAQEYWQTHYLFEKETGKIVPTRLAKESRSNIIINTIVPLLFAYGNEKRKSQYKDRALDILNSLPPENNKIIRAWKELKIVVSTAADSQALLELNNMYCSKVKCLECGIGTNILKTRSK